MSNYKTMSATVLFIVMAVVVLFILWGHRGHDPSLEHKTLTCPFEQWLKHNGTCP